MNKLLKQKFHLLLQRVNKIILSSKAFIQKKDLLANIFKYLNIHKSSIILIFVIIIAVIVHGANMFGYPSYREDEGTYMSQAWSVVSDGKLAPYTYWYDHSPFGWLVIGFWNIILGSFYAFGTSINSGRVLMLILHIITIYFLFKIVKKITKRLDAAVLASLVFTLSPLGIILQRRVFLDNIMVCFLIASLYFLIHKSSIKNMAYSSILFGAAVLSKESAIIFFPIILIFVIINSDKINKKYNAFIWGGVSLFLISLYPVFAFLRGELFPSGTIFGGNAPHVSLLEAFTFQSSRNGSFFLSTDSTFELSLWNTWLKFDPYLIILIPVITILNIIFRKKYLLFFSFLSIIYIGYLLYAQTLDWYMLPIIPLSAINIGLFYSEFIKFIINKKIFFPYIFKFVFITFLLSVFCFELIVSKDIFTLAQTNNQNSAIEWVKNNIDEKSIIVIDNYAFLDLNKSTKDIQEVKAQYYWKVDNDPEIKNVVLKNDWQNIDYLIVTPAFHDTVMKEKMPIVQSAYENSIIIKKFEENNLSGQDYPVEIRAVNNKSNILNSTWNWYKGKFILSEGRTIDPEQNNRTTSEGQAYSLLRSVYMNDKEYFDLVLRWSLNNLKRKEENLFSWVYGTDNLGNLNILDTSSASDSDEDIALSLLFAYKKWGDQRYYSLAKNIINDIWTKEAVQINGTYYMTSRANSEINGNYLINPSYFSPASYRIFSNIDKEHPWNQLADDVYTIINKVVSLHTFDNNTYLLPDWFIVTTNENYLKADDNKSDVYGFDAFRLNIRLSWDAQWYENSNAKIYLQKISSFYKNTIEKDKKLYAVYKLNGDKYVDYSSLSTESGALFSTYFDNKEIARNIYENRFASSLIDEKYWGNENDYYSQNWAWFTTAFYSAKMINLWN
ncbi:MAG: glycosyl hydrolase family 8 [bacterium]